MSSNEPRRIQLCLPGDHFHWENTHCNPPRDMLKHPAWKMVYLQGKQTNIPTSICFGICVFPYWFLKDTYLLWGQNPAPIENHGKPFVCWYFQRNHPSRVSGAGFCPSTVSLLFFSRNFGKCKTRFAASFATRGIGAGAAGSARTQEGPVQAMGHRSRQDDF